MTKLFFKMLGRFHAVRVIFGSIFIILGVVIFYQRLYKKDGVIKLSSDTIQETWMSLEEFVQLSRPNVTCPVCFGRDACDEIMKGITQGTLGISRMPFKDSALSRQPVHQVYKMKSGKVKYWMRPIQQSQTLVEGFEEFVCRNASIDKKKKSVTKCDVSIAAKSTFLYTSTLDLNSFQGLYRGHLVSPRRLPLTICPTYKLVRGLVEAFDEDLDLTLTAEEKAVLISTVATNPDVAVHKFILNQKLQFPVLPFFGACGRVSFIQGPHKPLRKFIQDSLPVRLDLANQILQLIDAFIHDDPSWLLFTTDINFDNLVVTQDENQVFLQDLSNVMLLDKDLLEPSAYSIEEEEGVEKTKKVESNKIGFCDDDCFNEFYNKLTSRKDNDKAKKEEETDALLSTTFGDCNKINEMASHMYTLACSLVLIDRHKGTSQGLLHSLNDSEEGEHKFPTSEIQRLLLRCSDDPRMHIRSEAAMELIELISGSGEKEANEADIENEDFNDNNIRFNENEDFHEKYEEEDQEGGASLPKKLIQGKP